MWAHYADNHNGACIEFDKHQIQRFKSLKKVTYANPGDEREEYPLLHGNLKEEDEKYQESAEEFLCKKATEWAYEHEYRLILPPMSKYIGCQYQKDDEKFILVSGIPQGAITKLIFGYNVPVSTRVAWAKMVQRNHPDCKFGKVAPDKTKYELKVEDIPMEAIENTSGQSST